VCSSDLLKSPKSSSEKDASKTLVFDIYITDEGGLEGDAQEFWDNMDEDFNFILNNLFDKLPVRVIHNGKIKIAEDYYMRYFVESDDSTEQLLTKYLDHLQKFCENPDRNYYGTFMMNVGDLAANQDINQIADSPALFEDGSVINAQHADEF
jgi:hypothetical protein